MASKVNPLFQDSTISSGTNIRTQFELKKVFLENDQQICVSLIEKEDVKFIEMKCIDSKTGTYACSVWLKHKQEIEYQFFIKTKELITQAMEPKKGLALYTVLETWEPVDNPELLDIVLQNVQQRPNHFYTEEASSDKPSNDNFIENLIEKWGL